MRVCAGLLCSWESSSSNTQRFSATLQHCHWRALRFLSTTLEQICSFTRCEEKCVFMTLSWRTAHRGGLLRHAVTQHEYNDHGIVPKKSLIELFPFQTQIFQVSTLGGAVTHLLNESRITRSKTQTRKKTKQAVSYVSICIWKIHAIYFYLCLFTRAFLFSSYLYCLCVVVSVYWKLMSPKQIPWMRKQ